MYNLPFGRCINVLELILLYALQPMKLLYYIGWDMVHSQATALKAEDEDEDEEPGPEELCDIDQLLDCLTTCS